MSEVKRGRKPTKISLYKNTGSRNVFTENGRCHPGETIELHDVYASNYPTLEKVSIVEIHDEDEQEGEEIA